MKIDDLKARIAKVFRLNAQAEEVRRHIPLHQRPDIDLITRGLPRGGPHLYNKKGPGLQYFDQRPFVSGQDDPRGIHPKYSQKDKRGQLIYVEREAEIRHNYYFWRSNKPSMDWKSEKATFTGREAAEIIMYAFAKHVARTHEQIGLLESGHTQRGDRVGEWMGMRLAQDASTHDMPRMQRLPAKQSSAVLISDFLPGDEEYSTPESLYKGLDQTLKMLRGQSVAGWVVMVADPQTLHFDYKDIELFKGVNDASIEINLGKGKRKEQQKEYKDILAEHINKLRQITKAYGFKFIIQRTDEPLQNALRAVYNIGPAEPASTARMEIKP